MALPKDATYCPICGERDDNALLLEAHYVRCAEERRYRMEIEAQQYAPVWTCKYCATPIPYGVTHGCYEMPGNKGRMSLIQSNRMV